MHGITIIYEFSGDEARWESAVADFVAAVNNDAAVRGKFNYTVHKVKEGNRRIHWGAWDVPETVKTLQSRDYFKTFAAALKEMAGDTLVTVPVARHTATSP